MPIYVWNGKNRAGDKKKGELEAASPEGNETPSTPHSSRGRSRSRAVMRRLR